MSDAITRAIDAGISQLIRKARWVGLNSDWQAMRDDPADWIDCDAAKASLLALIERRERESRAERDETIRRVAVRAFEICSDPERVARLEAVMGFEQTVVSWQGRTFPDATRESVLRHLSEEAGELQHAWALRSEDSVREEIGDVGLLLICLASMFGTTLERCMADKFATASKRTYAYDPALGYARHVDAQRAPDAAPGED